MIEDLGLATTLLIGFTFGFVGYAILSFWVGLIWKGFQYSKWYWPLFWVNMIFWIIATCTISMDFLEKTFDVWSKPFLIIVFGSLAIMAIDKFIKMK